MKILFQTVNFRKDDYNRPQDKWVCGRAKEGCACTLGPDSSGRCRIKAECQPTKKGDRWHCTRMESIGGKCKQGPLSDGSCCRPIAPCNPQRSLRSYRGLFTGFMAILTLALLLIFFNQPFRRYSVKPGPLSVVHSTVEDQCSACHQFDSGQHPVLEHGLDMFEVNKADSELCLNCHDLGEHAFNSHGVPFHDLVSLEFKMDDVADTSPDTESWLLKLSNNDKVKLAGMDGELVCGTCHQEHHGKQFNLSALSNNQCQVCHTEQFESLANGHPNFTEYPYRRRTKLIFDHFSHLKQHFTDPKFADSAPPNCMSCHVMDEHGQAMLVRGFERTCASCHENQILGDGRAGDKGLMFLRLPGVDAMTLNERGFIVGEWPEYAEGNITTFMQFMVENRYLEKAELAQIAKLDLLDLRDASDAELALVEKYVWAIKQLMFDLVVEGHEFLLKTIFNKKLPANKLSEAHRLTAGLPQEIVSAAQQTWLPNLMTDVPRFRQGVKPVWGTETEETPALDTSEVESGLMDDSGDGDLLGDDDGGGLLGDDEDDGGLLLGDDDEDSGLLGDDDGLLGDDDGSGGLLGDDEDDMGGLLADDDEGGLLGDDGDDGGLLGDDDADSSGGLLGGDMDESAAPDSVSIPDIKIKSHEDWVGSGGWYRNDLTYALYYRPVGHADAFIKGWIDRSSSLPSGISKETSMDIFHQLMGDSSIGLCSKCHSVDKIPLQRGYTINWLAERPNLIHHSFTKFRHMPHLSTFFDSGCIKCHELNKNAAYSESFENNMDPYTFESNFTDLASNTCVECHTPDVAGDSCLQCHNYHTGYFASNLAEKAAFIDQFLTEEEVIEEADSDNLDEEAEAVE